VYGKTEEKCGKSDRMVYREPPPGME